MLRLFSVLLLALFAQIAPAQEADVTPQPSNDALIQALEDPEQRARLIEALRTLPADATADPAPDAATAQTDPTLAEQAAEISQKIVVTLIDNADRMVSDFSRLLLLPELLTPERQQTILNELWPLLMTVAVTLISYRLLRILGRRLRQANVSHDDPTLRQLLAFIVQILARLVAIIVAAALGYATCIATFSGNGLGVSHAAFLNGFVAFGAVCLVLSLFVSRDARDLTFSRLPRETESVTYRSVRLVLGLLAYGLIAVVPISQFWVNFVLARSVRTIVLTLAAVAALVAIRRIARSIRAEPIAPDTAPDGQEVEASVASHTIGLWDRLWPSLAVLYVLVSYVVALSNPNQMLEIVGRATAFSALGLAALLVALRLMAHVGDARRVHLPRSVATLLPPLEARLSRFLPIGMVGASLLLIAFAICLFLGGWGIIDVVSWYSEIGGQLLWRIASFVLIAVVLILVWSVLTSWIDTKLSNDLQGAEVTARSRTLLALFKNVLTIALIVFGGMTALSELGIDIAPLLAGAGVIGLAIGFGAQKLVQDIITGVFIQLENAINEGEVITVAGLTGSVERLTIRSVGLRDVAGVYHLIPFSAVDTVSNFMRGFGFHVEVVGVAYESDLAQAKEAMHKAFDRLMDGQHGENIIAPLDWHGVVGLGDSSVNLRARVKTKPGQQWAIGRAYTELVKTELDAAGVEIPFPHRELRVSKSFIEAIGRG